MSDFASVQISELGAASACARALAASLRNRLVLENSAAAIEPVVALVPKYAWTLPMACATGGTRAIASKTLSALGLLQHFRAMVTADDVAHGKPAPDIFLEAARQLRVPPEACYAFEDAELGLQSARAAGMVAVDIRPLRKQLERDPSADV